MPTPLVVNPGKLLQREKFLVEPALKSIHPRARYNIHTMQCSAQTGAHHHYTKTNMSSHHSEEIKEDDKEYSEAQKKYVE